MLRKFCLLTLVCFLHLATLSAQTFNYRPDQESQKFISATSTATSYPIGPLNVETNLWPTMLNTAQANWGFQLKSVQDFVHVYVDHDNLDIKDYKYEISFSITGYLIGGVNSTIPISGNFTLTLEHNNTASSVYTDMNYYKFNSFSRFELTIEDVQLITPNNPPVQVSPSALAKDFIIEYGMNVERYDTKSFHLATNCSYLAASNELQVDWKATSSGQANCNYSQVTNVFPVKPILYELEWTYIDDYKSQLSNDNTTNTVTYGFTQNGSVIANAPINYNFKNNSTRIVTENLSYKIPMIYEHGAIMYRVRYLRPSLNNNYKDVVYSSWSFPESGSITAGDQCLAASGFVILNGYANSMNYQYSMSFAEEGKYKHVINYFDGALMSRQTQTKLNTYNDQVIAQENVYDHEGRPTVQSLPIPVTQPLLQYRPDLLLKSGNGPLTLLDVDALGCSQPPLLPQVNGANSLADKYYSPNNASQSGMQKYVPDAGGYPFTQTILSPEDPKKVLFQGGAGAALQIGNGHGTKIEYMEPLREELDLYLGTEAGKNEFYVKQVTTDPNGQSSYSIVDHAGKVAITGLLGSNPTSLVQLDNYSAGSPRNTDLLQDYTQERTASKIITQKGYYNDGPGNNTIQYSASIPPYQIGCTTVANRFLMPKASVTLDVFNDCGTSFVGSGLSPALTAGPSLQNSAAAHNYTPGTITMTNLPKGNYVVQKTLSFDAAASKEQVKDFFKTNEPTCSRDEADFIRQSVESQHFPCTSATGDPNPCDIKRKAMIQELYPGNKYGKYTKDGNGKFELGNPNSIFSMEITNIPTPTGSTSTVGNVTTTVSYSAITYSNGYKPQCNVTGCGTTQTCAGSPVKKCGCANGAHTEANPCCYSCLSNHCKCIQFGSYTVTTTVTTNPVNCGGISMFNAALEFPAYLNVNTLSQIYNNHPSVYPLSQTETCNGYQYTLTYKDDKIWTCSQGQQHHLYLYQTPGCFSQPYILYGDHNHSQGSTSTVTTTQTIPSLSTALLRYQSPCVVYPEPMVINGVTYTNAMIHALSPDEFMSIFNEQIAEALLPLHPEYCKLLACDGGDFEGKMNKLLTAVDAEGNNLFQLDDIVAADPFYANAPSSSATANHNALYYYNYTYNPSNPTAYVNKSIDVMAAEMVLCNAGNSPEKAQCIAEIYNNEIDQIHAGTFNFWNNEALKQRYFQTLKALYLANRGLVKQRIYDATGQSCPSCAAQRMTLIAPAVFTPIFNTSANNSYTSQPNIPSWMINVLNNDANSYNEVQTQYNNATTSNTNPLNSAYPSINLVRAQSICQNFKNCPLTASSLANLEIAVRDYLNTNGGKITYAQLKNILTNSPFNITLSGLCNPYLADLSLFDEEKAVKQQVCFTCPTGTLPADLATFLNNSVIQDAIQHANITSSYTASGTVSINTASTNTMALKALTALNLTSANLEVSSSIPYAGYGFGTLWASGNIFYFIKLTFSIGSVPQFSIFLKELEQVPTSSTPIPAIAGGVPTFSNARCVNDVPKTANSGFIAKRSMVLNATTSVSKDYIVWNDKIDFMGEIQDPFLAEAVTPLDLRRELENFINVDQPTYGYTLDVDHPLFGASLTNYLNVKFGKTYTWTDYLNLMEGSAISNFASLTSTPATVKVTISTSGLQAFLNTVQAFSFDVNNTSTTGDDWIYGLNPVKRIESSGSTSEVLFNLNSISPKLIRAYTDLLANAGGTLSYPAPQLAVYCKTSPTLPTIGGSSWTSTTVDIVRNNTTETYNKFTPVNYLPATYAPKDLSDFYSALYLAVNPIAGTIVTTDRAYLRSEDYTTAKEQFLNYVYSNYTTNIKHEDAIAAMIPATLQSQTGIGLDVTGGRIADYNDPLCRNSKTDLYNYIPSPTPATNGFDIVKSILTAVRNNNSGSWFTSQLATTYTTGLPSGISVLKVFKKSDGYFWYQAFSSAPGNKMYNIYVQEPKDMGAQNYTSIVDMDDITLAGADVTHKAFYLRVRYTNVATVHKTLHCRTDFPLYSSPSSVCFHNVILYKQDENLICKGENDCEYELLTDAVNQGKANYQVYFEKLVNETTTKMLDFLVQNTTETLMRNGLDQKYQQTVYSYDRVGNLIMTVPPAGVTPLNTTALGLVTGHRISNTFSFASNTNAYGTVPAHKKTSTYAYNAQNQLVFQSTPDGGTTNFYYDAAGRVVFSQNDKQRTPNYYSYTLYDDLGRVSESGEVKFAIPSMNANDPELPGGPEPGPQLASPPVPTGPVLRKERLFPSIPEAQAPMGPPSPIPSIVSNSYNGNLYPMYVMRTIIQNMNRREVVVYTYDDMKKDLSAVTDGEKLDKQENLRSRVAAICYFDNIGHNFTPVDKAFAEKTPTFGVHYSYDAIGNVKTATFEYNKLVTLKNKYKRVDYDYDLLSGKVNMVSYNRGWADQFYHRYSYDADNRVVMAETSNDALIWNKDAEYEYYRHGPLAKAKIGDLKVQSLEYAYTINGWLKATNSDVLDPEKDMGKNGIGTDLFARDVIAHGLHYFNSDYSAIGTSSAVVTNVAMPSTGAPADLYNGNIKAQTTSIAGLGNIMRTYKYDQLNRLIGANNWAVNDMQPGNTLTPSNIYKSSYTYDPDGNLKTLERYDGVSTNPIDAFVYNYTVPSSTVLADNKLRKVADGATSPPAYTDIKPLQVDNNYQYDEIGNLTKDQQEHLEIKWNHFGKTSMVHNTVNNQDEVFVYDGNGNRIFKDVVTKVDASTEDHKGSYYVRDATGNILAVYKLNNKVSPVDLVTSVLTAVSDVDLQDAATDRAFDRFPGFDDAFLNGIYDAHGSFAEALPLGKPLTFFVQGDHELMNNAIDDIRQNRLAEFYSYDKDNSTQILNTAWRQADGDLMTMGLGVMMGNAQRCASVLLACRDHLYEEGFKFLEEISGGIDPQDINYENLGEEISSSGSAPGAASALRNAIEANDVAIQEEFWTVLLENNDIFYEDDLTTPNEELADIMSEMLKQHSNIPGIVSYIGSWSESEDWLNTHTTEDTRFRIAYHAEPGAAVSTFIAEPGSRTYLTNVIAGLPGVTTAKIIKDFSDVLPELALPYAMTAVEETLALAEHHIYGSDRLGIQQYDGNDNQFTAKNHYTSTGYVFDVDLLNTRKPWFSVNYGELMDKNNTLTFGQPDHDEYVLSRKLGLRNYEMSDHLGNALATVLDRRIAHLQPNSTIYDYWLADVSSASDYYPFGMLMPGRSITSEKYRFGYSGKENDNEIKGVGNSLDFGARIYDSRLGRWLSLDPLQRRYPSLSPYIFAGNNPIFFVDPDGEKITVSKAFTKSEWNLTYTRLATTNSVYQGIMKVYENTTKYNLAMGVDETKVHEGAFAGTGTGKKLSVLNGKETLLQANSISNYNVTWADDHVETETEIKHYMYTDMGRAKTLIHEAIHMKLQTSGQDDNKDHENFATYQPLILKGLKEFNDEHHYGLNDEQLEDLSWSGVHKTKAFGILMQDRAKKNGTSVTDEKRKWYNSIRSTEYYLDSVDKKDCK